MYPLHSRHVILGNCLLLLPEYPTAAGRTGSTKGGGDPTPRHGGGHRGRRSTRCRWGQGPAGGVLPKLINRYLVIHAGKKSKQQLDAQFLSYNQQHNPCPQKIYRTKKFSHEIRLLRMDAIVTTLIFGNRSKFSKRKDHKRKGLRPGPLGTAHGEIKVLGLNAVGMLGNGSGLLCVGVPDRTLGRSFGAGGKGERYHCILLGCTPGLSTLHGDGWLPQPVPWALHTGPWRSRW